MEIQLFNSLGRRIEPFIPIEEGRVGMYTCGPTVYNYAHIGNLRTYIFEDLLRRMFRYFGYEVYHVMNVTDVGHLTDDADEGEDKMMVGARERKKTVWEIADYFADAFFLDLEKLRILKPMVSCRATDHIQDMIDLIARLEEKGHTYSAGGNIYYDISTFPGYGTLALLDRQELLSGARVHVDQSKKHPHDFALWFTRSKFKHQAMQWDSPWGRGYPGWHLECSAMSMKYLGEHFDIHCGGIDHIPVHHTNEIAQSEGATGTKWVNYWIHGEFLLMDTRKMAKSKGNFLTLSNLEASGYDPMDFRYFCLGGHYRSQLRFSEESLTAARNARLNLVERLTSSIRDPAEVGPMEEHLPPEVSDESSLQYLKRFKKHLSQDLNIPRALAELWGAVKDEDIPGEDKVSLALEMDKVLGLGLKEQIIRKDDLEHEYAELIRAREQARKDRDFKRADEIRDILRRKNIVIEDAPDGTRWKRIE